MNELIQTRANEMGVTKRQILNAIRFPRIRQTNDGIIRVYKTFSDRTLILNYTQAGDVFKIASISEEK
jgi:hypothetical protein